MRDTLRRLWDVRDWNGWVELRGCQVGAGAAGSQFLTLRANAIWEVSVYAGEVDQAVVVDDSENLGLPGRDPALTTANAWT
jgi:hypothetical protein